MRRIYIAIFLVALITLMLELLLTRIFDAILYPNLGYMVITCAMFALSLAGIHATLRGVPDPEEAPAHLARVAALYGASLLLVRPALNLLPFRFEAIAAAPVQQAVYFAGMFLAVGAPFLLAGRIFTVAFACFPKNVQRIYFYDLVGAGIGCVVLIPLLQPLGPGGLLLWAAAGLWLTAGLLTPTRAFRNLAIVGAVLALAVPMALPGYLDFVEHKPDRGLQEARSAGESELVAWDPISKIEVIGWGGNKNIIYDGGTQSSFLYRWDGDVDRLRRRMDRAVRQNREDLVERHFWYRSVFASHYLKRDTDYDVLVIGSAAGQEVKAGLVYGAESIDAVELVPTVVRLGLEEYAEFNGGVFLDPRVHVRAGEGRAFLRSRDRAYDIIQLHSDHSSSSIAGGVGALDPTYLMTVDAFQEYFGHLTDDGIVHINHHIYPRIVTTAARAWRESGRQDFRRHVLVVHRPAIADTLPTVLIKMSPWTEAEMAEMSRFFGLDEAGSRYAVAEHPLDPRRSLLPRSLYTGLRVDRVYDEVPYRLRPATDDQPYFKFIRRTWEPVEIDHDRLVDRAMRHLLNEPVQRGPGIPMDVLHLVVVGALSLAFAVLFVGLPLAASPVGRRPWPGKAAALIYFACLGAGFIILELVLIQKLMRFVGFPLYAYSVVIFTLLMAAGIGSLMSERLGIGPRRRRWVPFAGIFVLAIGFLLTHEAVFDAFLHLPVAARVGISAACLFPLGFFLGMPFPLGILTVEREGSAAVAWAWGMNGLFTVIGGLASVLLSLQIGFNATELVALGIYGIAFLALHRCAAATARPEE